MRKRLPLTELERGQLLAVVGVRRNHWATYAPYLDMIGPALRDAELVPEMRWDGVAGLGSVVEVRAVAGGGGVGETARWVLVRPGEEEEREGRVSVLSPLGWELLGVEAGDRVYVEEGAYVVEGVTGPAVMYGVPRAAMWEGAR